MSLVCSVIFIHHAFNANILDKDYAFSDGEILMVDNAVRTHFEPYERHFKEIGFNENTIKKYLQCTNIQTVTMPVPAKFLRASNVPTGLLNEMIAYLNFIRQFESFVSRFLGNGHTSCIFQESCKDNLVVESNGDIYECDHFVYPQYKIGNINKSELKTMNSVQLTAQKKRISAKCQQCVYKPICNGGCPKHRITKVNNETISYFCEGYKILFSTMVPYMNAMVELAKNRVPLYHIMDVAKQMENN